MSNSITDGRIVRNGITYYVEDGIEYPIENPKPKRQEITDEQFNRAMRARSAEPDRPRAVPTPPLPAFPDTDLYANLIDLMGGDSASLDYLLGLLWSRNAEREMRAIVLLGGRRSILQLLRTIRQGFDASEVVSLPYNLIQPGAPHTRRTEPLAQVENKRLILFDPGESDPKLHAGIVCQFAERDYVSCVTKGGATSIRVNAATTITVAGMPDCEDNRMAERCAVFELCGAATYGPKTREIEAMVKHAESVKLAGMPDAVAGRTTDVFPYSVYDIVRQGLSFSSHPVDARDKVQEILAREMARRNPKAELPTDKNRAAWAKRIGLKSRNFRVGKQTRTGFVRRDSRVVKWANGGFIDRSC